MAEPQPRKEAKPQDDPTKMDADIKKEDVAKATVEGIESPDEENVDRAM